jgi:hypothetical protein
VIPDTGSLPAATIVFHNYEIYHGPIGPRYNRIFPVTAIDSSGKVYAFFTDGNRMFVKTDATGKGWNPAVAPSVIPNPAGVNTTIMPWVDAGSKARVDVVFYGASGGAGAQPNPQDDPKNQWNVYFAQSIDGAKTWSVVKASDHVIHTGPLCIDGLNCNLFGNRDRTLLDFFQVAIDPTNGAADVAYADDHGSPGSAVMYYTRQCAGAPAVTGLSVPVTDCKAPIPPPPPPVATACVPIQDVLGDAPNNYPGGDGNNMNNLDIANGSFRSDAVNLNVRLTLNDLEAPPPPANLVSAFWTVYWTTSSVNYYARASTNGVGPAAVGTYRWGTYDPQTGNTITGNSTTGEFHPGLGGYFIVNVPRSTLFGNGTVVTNAFADTHGSFTVAGRGVYYTAAADRAPDSGYGASYTVGQAC